MVQVNEALTGKGPLGAALEGGIDNISYYGTVTFTQYVKLVLPADGFVFWVKADLLSKGALFNALRYNAIAYNQATVIKTPAATISARGAFHYATEVSQEEDKTFSTNRVLFTSETEITDLNAVGPNLLYIAEHDGIKFAFSRRGYYFDPADVWHYEGSAVYSDIQTQIIDSLAGAQALGPLIVSNSLPIWIGMNSYVNQEWELVSNPVVMYPSYLLPENLAPPYAAVHVEPNDTEAIQSAAYIHPGDMSHYQLARDRVRITTVGLNNDAVMDFVDFITQFITNHSSTIGLMNSPIVRDGKRGQVELQALAQEKVIDFEVSYYQTRIRTLAEQLILQAFVTFIVQS